MFEEFEPDVEGLSASQRALVHDLQSVAIADARGPSRLDGWTVGHVLTHLARNADSYRSLLDDRPQYAGGWSERNAHIDAGAGRPWRQLVDDVASTGEALEEAFRRERDWNRRVPMLLGAQPARFLPHARRREVEVHRVDLGFGYEFSDVPADFMVADLELLSRWWIAANPTERGLPEPVLGLNARQRWLWLLGRFDAVGVPSASLL